MRRQRLLGGLLAGRAPLRVVVRQCPPVLAQLRLPPGSAALRVRAVVEEPHGAADSSSGGGSRPARASSIRWARRQRMLASEPRLGAGEEELIELNVGGRLMQTTRSTLLQVPGSRLAAMFRRGEEGALAYDAAGRVWLDFDPSLFQLVLRLLRELRMSGGRRRTACLPAVAPADEAPFRRLLSYLGLLPYASAPIPLAFCHDPLTDEPLEAAIATPLLLTGGTSEPISRSTMQQQQQQRQHEGQQQQQPQRYRRQQRGKEQQRGPPAQQQGRRAIAAAGKIRQQQAAQPPEAQFESEDLIPEVATWSILSDPPAQGEVESYAREGQPLGDASVSGSSSSLQALQPHNRRGHPGKTQAQGQAGAQAGAGAQAHGEGLGSGPEGPCGPSLGSSLGDDSRRRRPSRPASLAPCSAAASSASSSERAPSDGLNSLVPSVERPPGGPAAGRSPKLSPPPSRGIASSGGVTSSGASQLFYISTDYSEARGLRVSVYTENDLRAGFGVPSPPQPSAPPSSAPPSSSRRDAAGGGAGASGSGAPAVSGAAGQVSEPFDIFIDATYGESQLSLTFVSRREMLPGGVFLGLTSRAQLDRKGAQIPCYGWKSNGCTYNDHTGAGRLGSSRQVPERSDGGAAIRLGWGGSGSLAHQAPVDWIQRPLSDGDVERRPLWSKGDSVELILRQGQPHNQLLLKVNGRAIDVINRLPSFRNWSWYVGLWAGGDVSCAVFQRDQYAVYWGDYTVKRYL